MACVAITRLVLLYGIVLPKLALNNHSMTLVTENEKR
jgi:hypothetical protein